MPAHRSTRAIPLTAEAIDRFGRKPKAVRLAAAGQLTRLDHLSYGLQVVYVVTGDHGRYRCTLYGAPDGPRSAVCGCPTRGLCSHMLAALAVSSGALDGDEAKGVAV